jgi:hypothetical protein
MGSNEHEYSNIQLRIIALKQATKLQMSINAGRLNSPFTVIGKANEFYEWLKKGPLTNR